jgi:hypothetical protein
MIRPAIERLLEQASVLAKRAIIVLNVGARRNTSNPEGLLVESHARPLRYTGDCHHASRFVDYTRRGRRAFVPHPARSFTSS